MRTLAFLHQKGGTGKTTRAIATAMALAEQGARVLLLDADGQGTASEWASNGPCESPRGPAGNPAG